VHSLKELQDAATETDPLMVKMSAPLIGRNPLPRIVTAVGVLAANFDGVIDEIEIFSCLERRIQPVSATSSASFSDGVMN